MFVAISYTGKLCEHNWQVHKNDIGARWWCWPWQVYGALYILFVKLNARGKEPTSSDRQVAGFAVATVKSVWLWCFQDWYQIYTGWQMKTDASEYLAVFVLLALFEYWFFDKLGFGKYFETQFEAFSRRRRVLTGCAAIASVIVLAFFEDHTRSIYMQTFHLPT